MFCDMYKSPHKMLEIYSILLIEWDHDESADFSLNGGIVVMLV